MQKRLIKLIFNIFIYYNYDATKDEFRNCWIFSILLNNTEDEHNEKICDILVYDSFKKYVNNEVGKELEKSENSDYELPPEMIVQ